jgi:hypothetical protein
MIEFFSCFSAGQGVATLSFVPKRVKIWRETPHADATCAMQHLRR